jgi:nitrogen fixation-related uncharacterized protein
VNPLEEDEEGWPDEPEEFDPESLAPDSPDPTPARSGTQAVDADVPDGLFRAFWAAVLFLNVAIAALAIGLMLIYFQGDYRTGLPAVLVGTVAAFGAGRYYWGVKTGRYTDDGGRDGSENRDGSAGENDQ